MILQKQNGQLKPIAVTNIIEVPSTPKQALDKGVNFIDFDGTVIKTWKPEEVATKTSLPANPDRTGYKWRGLPCSLTSQGWNWTLQEIQTQMQIYPSCTCMVGQVYTTNDESTKWCVEVSELKPCVRLALYLNKNSEVTINWGDGSTTQDSVTTAGNIVEFHTYSNAGNYIISVLPTEGSFKISGSSTIPYLLFLGSEDETLLTTYANVRQPLYEFHSGKDMSIGGYVNAIKSYLRFITLSNETSWGGAYAFSGSDKLECAILPKSYLPDGNCWVFNSCSALRMISLHCLSGYSGILGSYLLGGVTGIEYLTIPYTITGLNYAAIYSVPNLRNLVVPSFVTALGGSSIFLRTESIEELVIPSTVESIANFTNCYNLCELKFESSTPPTLANANVFSNLYKSCKILVPRGSLNAYKTATNYPDPEVYTYEEY